MYTVSLFIATLATLAFAIIVYFTSQSKATPAAVAVEPPYTVPVKPAAKKGPLTAREEFALRMQRPQLTSKHWGSKRFLCNHRGNGHGKPSAR